jgi:hypothetical protein
MALENDFLVFAGASGSNVVPQASYLGATWQTGGFSSGIAQSAQLNKVWRQSSIMAAVLASFIVNNSGHTAIDDGTTATLLANLQAAVSAAARTATILTDTGTANAYAAANPAPLAALPTASGFAQKVAIAHANTGASTYAPDGLTAAPIYGLAGSALQGGELPTNGLATLVSFVSPLLNGGNLCWILYECVGGSQQVAAGTQTNHAVNLGQFASLAASNGYMKLPNGLIVQWGGTGASVVGGSTITFPIAFPNNVFAVTLGATTVGSANFPSISASTLTKTGFPYSVWGLSGTTVAGLGSTYIAIGN